MWIADPYESELFRENLNARKTSYGVQLPLWKGTLERSWLSHLQTAPLLGLAILDSADTPQQETHAVGGSTNTYTREEPPPEARGVPGCDASRRTHRRNPDIGLEKASSIR